jgi:hypothetical protein
MPEQIRPADRPIVDGLDHLEVVYAKNQPEYLPLRTLCSGSPDRRVTSRWTLTPDQREAVAEGADIFLTLLTYGGSVHPVMMAVAKEPTEDMVRHNFQLELSVHR